MGEYRSGQTAGRVAVLVVPWAWLALFLIAPMAIVVRIAFSEAADAVPPYAPRLNLASVAQVLGDPLYARALWLSVKVAGLSTLACLIAGYPMALAIARAAERRVFGRDVIDYDATQQAIARSRIEIEQARLLVLRTAERLDHGGHRMAWRDVSMAKVAVPEMAQRVADPDGRAVGRPRCGLGG